MRDINKIYSAIFISLNYPFYTELFLLHLLNVYLFVCPFFNDHHQLLATKKRVPFGTR